MWQEPINYRQADGDLVPIDVSLDEQPDGTLETEATDYQLDLPETIEDPVEVAHGGASVEFALHGAESPPASVDGEVATFVDALPGVDAVYTAQTDSVKEDLVLADRDAQRSFTFDLDPSPGVTPELNADGGVDFVDADGNTPIRFAPPIMADAAGATSTDLEYKLDQAGQGRWALRLDADTPWLRDSARQFPVRVDPTAYFGVFNYLNTHFNFAQANTSYGGTIGPLFLNAGYVPDNSTSWRTVIKMTLSGIPSNAKVTSAKVNLHESGDPSALQSGSPVVNVHGLTNDFNLSATYNKRDGVNNWAAAGGDFSGTVQDSKTISPTCNCFYSWNITPLAQSWVNGTRANQGMMVKSNSGANGSVAAFDSLRTGQYAPWMEVAWLPVDSDGPDIDISGAFRDATDDDPRLTAGASYAVAAEARDFNDGTAQVSGTTRLEIFVDGVSKAVQTVRNCTTGCDMKLDWTLNTAAYARGEHELQVVAVDASGNRSERRVEWETHKYRETAPSVTRDLTGATRIIGAAAGDGAGAATAPAGDLDYDGYDELLVGAPAADPAGRANAGSVFVARGSEPGATVDLANAGAVFLRINGATAGERAGSSVANIGDVNDDLLDDWAIGAPAATQEAASNPRGKVYVVFGRETSGTVDLANLGSSGYRILGPPPGSVTAPSQAGPALQPFGATLGGQGSNDDEQQGDVNGDDRPDLAIGYSAASNGTGRAYVVFGKAGTADVDVTTLGSGGFTISGGGGFRAGHSVAIPGDLNGDDNADVAVAQPGAGPANTSDANRAGGIAILYGAASPTNVTLTAPLATARGYLAAGGAGDRLTAVGSIGDVDGDGLTDVGYAGAMSGALYGRLSGAATLRTASDGFWATQNVAATSVNGTGDVNGDDIADIAVGSPASGTTGSTTVIFGDQETSNLGPITAIGGHQGRTFTPPSGTTGFGAFVDGADDVSGDAVDDIALAAPNTTANGRAGAGAVWILPGATHLEGDAAVGSVSAQRIVDEVQNHKDLRRLTLGTPVEYRRMAKSDDKHGPNCNAAGPNPVEPGNYNDAYRRTAIRRFGSWTIENDMKPSSLWNGVTDDNGTPRIVLDPAAENRINALICLAKAENKKVRGHALLFAQDSTVPAFLKDPTRLSPTVEGGTQRWFYQPPNSTRKFPVRQLVRLYIEAVMTHEGWGMIDTWDVVNEAINPQGGLKRPGSAADQAGGAFWADKLNDTDHKNTRPLTKNNWVTDAFVWARDAGPSNDRLVLNEVQVDDTGTGSAPAENKPARSATARGLFRGVSRRVCTGLSLAKCPQPIGFGFQMHRGPNPGAGDDPADVALFKNQWKLFLDTKWRGRPRCKTNEQAPRDCKRDAPRKPTIEVTEMDVDYGRDVTPEPDFGQPDTGSGRVLPLDEEAEQQLGVFQDGAQACQEVRRCVRFTSWGVTDQYSFRDEEVTEIDPTPGDPNDPLPPPCVNDGTPPYAGTVGCLTDQPHRYPTLFAISTIVFKAGQEGVPEQRWYEPKLAYFDVTDWLGQCKQPIADDRSQTRCDDRSH